MMQAHQQAYGGGQGGYGSSGSMDSGTIGSAAALNALKQHTQGGGVQSQNNFVGVAMAEASKLFDQQNGGQQSGQSYSSGKQSAIQSAATQALKMYMGGGSSSSSGSMGSSGLMSLASKFF